MINNSIAYVCKTIALRMYAKQQYCTCMRNKKLRTYDK